MYIAGVPIVGRESKNVYRWCAHCRVHIEGCISLVLPLLDASPRMYIVGAPIVESESRDIYRWCAQCRI